jgi:Regulator of chromosome condensation (RCC1) repeat
VQLMPSGPHQSYPTVLAAAVALLAACGDGPTEVPLPAEMRLLSPPTQAGTPGWPLTDSVIVEALDAQGNALSGVTINWSALNSGDKLGRLADTTNAAGRAAVEWTLGLAEGEQTLTITAAGLDAVTLTVTATATIFHAASVTLGAVSACALTDNGRAYCWGKNYQGQLGNGTVGDSTDVPTPVAGDLVFAALTGSSSHVCGLDTGGAAYCWGNNSEGETGTGTLSPSVPTPTAVQTGLRFTGISAEGPGTFSNSTCGLTAAGEAWCWGANQFGQLGDGTTNSSAVPVQVQTDVPFSSIETGYFHSCGIAVTGELWCWGEQEVDPGAFGARPAGLYPTPVLVHDDFRFVALETLRNSTCGLTAQQLAFCWGSDNSGSLGQGQLTEGSAVPLQVTGGHSFISLSSTYFEEIHGLTPDGVLYRWGSPGNDVVQATPVMVAQIGFTQMDSGGSPFGVAYGALGACGVIPGGAVYCVQDDGLSRGVPAPVTPEL